MKFCKQCGAKVVPPATFCEECGLRFVPQRDADPSASDKSLLAACTLVLLFLLLAVLLYWSQPGSKPKPHTVSTPSAPISPERLWEQDEAKRRDDPAYRLLAIQRDRNRDVVAELERLRERNDMAGFRAVLGARAVELNAVIEAVEADYDTYSIEDKRNILNTLTKERDWALSSYAGLKSLDLE